MKKVIAGIILLFLFTTNIVSQIYDKHCYYGISFDISDNRNWGYGELIITDVEPHSPAEAAGLKVNDIIMEINGKATYLRDNATIASWLFDNPNPVVTFTIRNIDTYFKEYTLERQCITVNSVDERFLSTAFSFYSLENSRQQNFTLPLQVTTHKEADFTDYHTFGFYDDGSDVPDIDIRLKGILEKALIEKGLKKDNESPDIWISLYYEWTQNPLFTGLNQTGKRPSTARYNISKQRMVNLPIFDPKKEDVNTNAQYIAKIGFTFYENKYIDPTKFTQLWECSIEDYLADNYTLEEYARVHIPLILMQYPYSTTKNKADYHVFYNKYNYTGMHFDADEPNKVNDVDVNSPAYNAGIRPGYYINKIDGKNTKLSKEQITEGYRKFYQDTEKFRDKNSKFIGPEEYANCMFWDRGYYSEIAKYFKKREYNTAYSYIFDFAEYVNPDYKGRMTIEAWDGIQKRIFYVEPIIRESTTIKTFPK